MKRLVPIEHMSSEQLAKILYESQVEDNTSGRQALSLYQVKVEDKITSSATKLEL